MKYLTIATFAAVALALSSCAAPAASTPPPAPVTAEASPTPTATTLPAGKFKLTTLSGAEVTFTLPTPVTHPAVKAIEAYRVKAGGAPVSYLVAEVDNRKGTESVNMYRVDAFDADGAQYTFSTVTEALSAWSPEYGSDYKYTSAAGKPLDDATGDALQREGVALHNEHLSGADVAEKAMLILQSPTTELPTEFTRVSVQPSGGGEGEDATPAP